MRITSLILISFLFLAISCNQNSVELVKTYEKLHNEHDIEGAMLLYHENIEFELVGTWIKSGKEEIRALEEWDRALNSNLKFESFEVKGDSVFCKVIERNDWFKAVGIKQIVHDPTIFIVSKGRINKIIANPSREIGKQIGAKIGSIYTWLKTTNDNTINELIVNGEFIYSEEAAKKWIKLLNRWNNYKTADQIK
jgi:hypothetical protein